MSSYNQQQPHVGVHPPQGSPLEPEGYPKDAYPPQGYTPPQQHKSGPSFLEGCLVALRCCWLRLVVKLVFKLGRLSLRWEDFCRSYTKEEYDHRSPLDLPV
uniref:Programmed cell death 6-interacting protein n=1 Tax=Anthurium amnicola TaxID=1678845 RepID=A0A1D1ZGG4_9ARAE